MTLMHFIFSGEAVVLQLGTVGVESVVMEKLSDSDIAVTPYDTADQDTILNDNLDGLLIADGTSYHLILENNDPAMAQALRMKIVQTTSSTILSGMAGKLGIDTSTNEICTDYIYGSAIRTFLIPSIRS